MKKIEFSILALFLGLSVLMFTMLLMNISRHNDYGILGSAISMWAFSLISGITLGISEGRKTENK